MGDAPRSVRVSVPGQELDGLRDAFLARLPVGAEIKDVDLVVGALRFVTKFARRDSEIRQRLDRMVFDCATEAGQLVADSLLGGEGKARVEITPETGAVIVVLPTGERRKLDPISAATRDVSAFFGGARV